MGSPVSGPGNPHGEGSVVKPLEEQAQNPSTSPTTGNGIESGPGNPHGEGAKSSTASGSNG